MGSRLSKKTRQRPASPPPSPSPSPSPPPQQQAQPQPQPQKPRPNQPPQDVSSNSLLLTPNVLRVFVSSSFKDFGEERDVLVNQIFPNIRKNVCQPRALTLFEIDLRWGITSEQSQNGEVLSICLREIDKCRPYFIGMLGARVGWVLSKSVIPAQIMSEFPWLDSFVGETVAASHHPSVTELEIRYALQVSPVKILDASDSKLLARCLATQQRALFYLRDIAYVPLHESKLVADYLPDFDGAQAKMQSIREMVAASTVATRIRNYSKIDEFADMVYQDIASTIQADFPRNSTGSSKHGKGGDGFEVESALLASYKNTLMSCAFRQLTVCDVVFGAVQSALAANAAATPVGGVHSLPPSSAPSSSSSSPLSSATTLPPSSEFVICLKGDAGSGKSTIVTEVSDRLTAAGVLAVHVVIGAFPSSHSVAGLIVHMWMQILVALAAPSNLPRPPTHTDASSSDSGSGSSNPSVAIDKKVLEGWAALLDVVSKHLAAAGKKLAVFVDGIDKTYEMNEAKECDVLDTRFLPPVAVPAHIVLVLAYNATASFAKHVETKRKYNVITVPDLTVAEREGVLLSRLKLFNKNLTAEQKKMIIDAEGSTSPLFISILSEEVRVFGNFEKLSEEIRQCAARQTPAALYIRTLERLESSHSREAIAKIFSYLLANGNRGLLESEVLRVCDIPPLTLSAVSSTIGDSALVCKIGGALVLQSSALQSACFQRYFAGERSSLCKKKIELAEFFLRADSRRTAVQVLHLYLESGSHDLLFDFLSNLSTFFTLKLAAAGDLILAWDTLRKNKYDVEVYARTVLQSVGESEGKDDDDGGDDEGDDGKEQGGAGGAGGAGGSGDGSGDGELTEKKILAKYMGSKDALSKFHVKRVFKPDLSVLTSSFFDYSGTSTASAGGGGNGNGDDEGIVSVRGAAVLSTLAWFYRVLGFVGLSKQLTSRARSCSNTVIEFVSNNQALAWIENQDKKYTSAIEITLKNLSMLEEMQKIKTLSDNKKRQMMALKADVLNSLGVFSKNLKDYPTAVRYYQHSLAMRVEIFGEDSEEASWILFNLGHCQSLMNARETQEAAETNLLRSLQVLEAIVGPAHPSLAIRCNAIGRFYMQRRDFAKSEEYYLRSLKIRTKQYGSGHSDLGYAYDGLGSLYWAQGNMKKALEYFRLVVQVQSSYFRDDNISLCDSRLELADKIWLANRLPDRSAAGAGAGRDSAHSDADGVGDDADVVVEEDRSGGDDNSKDSTAAYAAEVTDIPKEDVEEMMMQYEKCAHALRSRSDKKSKWQLKRVQYRLALLQKQHEHM